MPGLTSTSGSTGGGDSDFEAMFNQAKEAISGQQDAATSGKETPENGLRTIAWGPRVKIITAREAATDARLGANPLGDQLKRPTLTPLSSLMGLAFPAGDAIKIADAKTQALGDQPTDLKEESTKTDGEPGVVQINTDLAQMLASFMAHLPKLPVTPTPQTEASSSPAATALASGTTSPPVINQPDTNTVLGPQVGQPLPTAPTLPAETPQPTLQASLVVQSTPVYIQLSANSDARPVSARDENADSAIDPFVDDETEGSNKAAGQLPGGASTEIGELIRPERFGHQQNDQRDQSAAGNGPAVPVIPADAPAQVLELASITDPALPITPVNAEPPRPTLAGPQTIDLGAHAPSREEAFRDQYFQRSEQYQQLTNQLMDALGQRLTAQYMRGAWSMSLQLSPAHLGKIDVRLDMGDGGAVKAEFSAERGHTREMLNGGLSKLKDGLEQSGFNVNRLSVDPEGQHSGGAQARSQQQDQTQFSSSSGQRGSPEQRAEKSTPNPEAAPLAQPAANKPLIRDDGTLDVTV